MSRLRAEAAGGKDVVLGGGVATVRAFVAAGLVGELHVAVAPVLLGGGERLFAELPGLTGYACSPLACSGGVAHLRLRRAEAGGGAAAGT